MRIEIKHNEGKYPSFDVLLYDQGEDPFLTVKGCRIVQGQKGPFVSWPATKNQTTGKYWNHCYASQAFSDAVINKAQARVAPKPRIESPPARPTVDDDDLPPF